MALSPYEIANEEFTCAHVTTELRIKTAVNGALAYVRQCQRCGDTAMVLRKVSIPPPVLATMPPFDEALRDRWRARWRARIDDLKAANDDAWWARYDAYLETPQWRAKRQLVLRRAHGRCEGCGLQAATEVHHLTYKRVTQEMLFDLVAVCDACHERVHQNREVPA